MELTHFDQTGAAIMVDVTEKKETVRTATASGVIHTGGDAFEAIRRGTAAKGDVLGVARIAGIMGVKKTSDLIPLCHPLPIGKVSIDFDLHPDSCSVVCRCTVKTTAQTGVEMEALTGVSTALLTVYDMCKAIDKSMEITDICLMRKSGGKSGEFIRPGTQTEEDSHA